MVTRSVAASATVHQRRSLRWKAVSHDDREEGGRGLSGAGMYAGAGCKSAPSAGLVICSISVGVMIAPRSARPSGLARARPRAVYLADLRARLRLRRDVVCERLGVRLPRRTEAAVGRAHRLLDIEEGRGVEPGRRRPDVGQLPAGAPAVTVQPDTRAACRIPDRERKVVVAGVSARTDPRELLTERLGDARAGVPDLNQARARHPVVEPAPGAAPGRHRAPGQAEGQAAVDRPPHLELVPRAGEGLDQ